MANAGRVAIVPKGEYNSATAYKRLDLVRYNNAVYVAKKANTGVSPTKTDTWMFCIQNVTQEQYDDLISGAVQVESAKEADNALLLENLTAKQVGESGARNLIPYPYYETTHEDDGITWTDNGDGTITANGTATDWSYYTAFNASRTSVLPGIYTLSVEQDGDDIIYVGIDKVQQSDHAYVKRYGEGKKSATFEYPSEEVGIYYIRTWIAIAKGTTVNNVKIRPMLEIGSVAHDYVPYHNGGAEDSQKLNGLTAEEFVSNENLLINSYFKDPVNTSGLTEWVSSGDTIDKWILNNTSSVHAVLSEDGITLDNFSSGSWFYQKLDISKLPLGKNVKVSIKADGVIKTATIQLPDTIGAGDTIDGYNYSLGDTGYYFDLYKYREWSDFIVLRIVSSSSTSITIEWMKLEVGSVATPFIPPNKEIEKLKCGVVDMPVNKTSTDLDQEFYLTNGVTITKYTGTTLNTPYTQGLTDAQNGKCITSSSGSATTYAIQLALPNGKNVVYVRKMAGGTIGKWANIADGGDADTVDGYHASDFLLSTAINKGTTAPTDTKALWVDTANKVIKAYIDGAWTALA